MKEFLIFCSDPSGYYHNPIKHFKWTTTDFSNDEIVFYTDRMIMIPNKIGKIKIAWIFEPKEINSVVYDYIKNNYTEFDHIFTWDVELLKIDSRFKLLTYGTSWISESQYCIYDKSKLISIVASNKNQLEGHKLRHNIIKNISNIDVYGRGYNPIDTLLPAFKEYYFSIVVENVKNDCNFSEKLITPMLCGTVPIFWGGDCVKSIFNPRGILFFNSIEELKIIMSNISTEMYNDMYPYILENFEIAKQHELVDNTLYNKLIELGIVNE